MKTSPWLSAFALAALWLPRGPVPGAAPAADLVGITVPSQVAAVAAEQDGKITAMPVQEMQRVEEGELLFELNATLEQLEVERLRALADSDVAGRRAAVMLAQVERDTKRIVEMAEQDIVSQSDLQAQQQELELARLRVDQAQLERAQAVNALRQAEERRAQRSVRSPFRGVVTQRLKSAGEAVEKFVPVVEVMSLDPLWIEFECPLTQQHLFRKGGTAVVAPTEAPDDKRTATILLTSVKSNASSHSFMVRAAVPNPELRWKTGQKMTVEADGAQPAPAGK
ncbi:MAG: efflux RND transporter periplasmic adaptor subunit [Planctomycetota bacterium]|jgi:RND family efflux transporter MFP subunit